MAAGAQEFCCGTAAHAVRAHEKAWPRPVNLEPAVEQAPERHGVVAADRHRLELAFHRLADVHDAISGRDSGRERKRDVDVDDSRRGADADAAAGAAGTARGGE